MNTLEAMIEVYGLQTILEQNDIEEVTVLEMLVQRGLVDPEDYIYTDMEIDDDCES